MDRSTLDADKLIEIKTGQLEHFATDIRQLYFEGLNEKNIQIIEFMLCNCEDITKELRRVIRELTESFKK